MTAISRLEWVLLSRPAKIGILVGLTYGLVARILVSNHWTSGAFGVMTIGFLFVVPVVMGYLTVRPIPEPSSSAKLFAPWVTCMLVVLCSLVGGLEGTICAVFALPVMLGLSSIGGLIAGSRPGRSPVVLPVAFVLPWAVLGVENGGQAPTRFVMTTTSIEIAAPAAVVWPLVVSVDTIRPEERRSALFTRIGFPQPIAATLSHPGVGGVRRASFERGIVFREAVTEWIPEKRIRFTIDATTVPPTALDEHVRIGGPFFDVLDGTYTLQPVSASRTLLILQSRHRVSTRFNAYAGWWATRVMESIQNNILHVLRDRAERNATRERAT
jgi:hypothetical protein